MPGAGHTLYGMFGGSSGPASPMPGSGLGSTGPSSAAALSQAFQTRMAALSSIAASLLGKREVLAHQAALVEARASEVAACRAAIEKETLADTEGVLHRLRAAEAGKMSSLSTDLDALRSDMSAIDRFYASLRAHQPQSGALGSSAAGAAAMTANAAAGAPPPAGAGALDDAERSAALAFMRAYPDLCAEADRLIAKPVKTAIEIRADDLPREAVERLEVCAKHTALLDLVAAKDRILLQLIRERDELLSQVQQLEQDERKSASLLLTKKAEEAMNAESVERTKEEAAYWMRLAEELSTELGAMTERLLRKKEGGHGSAAAAGSDQRQGGAPEEVEG